jgi:hypothetical protein
MNRHLYVIGMILLIIGSVAMFQIYVWYLDALDPVFQAVLEGDLWDGMMHSISINLLFVISGVIIVTGLGFIIYSLIDKEVH